ncbi:SIR2 family NAD-dependent protein deacylase [Pseudomonas syringae]|uniref:SIR2 family NAD-dependent protein deacylase n=1 Tax=Pseudomonas syringae TaxID=317 RepID=UPI001F101753|nr:SIR2 family protein [Pseudomonas syringae]MCH5651202.1 SIR2 family protein [Pseudomonas syringae]
MNCLDQLDDTAKSKLLGSIFSKNYFLWVGSGFSYNFGYVSWGKVLKLVGKELEYPLDLDLSSPLRAAELLCSYAITKLRWTEYQFNSLVAKCLQDSKKNTKDPCWTDRFRRFTPNMIVTTNWDDQLEKIFDGLINVVVRKDKSPQISSKGKNLLKIHGDAGRPASIVVTQSQYFSFQREDTYLNRKIYTLFSEASPIFLGYSLTDPNISFLYDEVYAHMGEEKPPAYMVVHPTESEQVLEETRLLFASKNIHIIQAEIGDFINDLAIEYKKYMTSNKSFDEEYKNIIPRLNGVFTEINKKRDVENDNKIGVFKTKEARRQAISALVEILNDQNLYTKFGGNLLAPENRMPYSIIDLVVGAVIWLVNKAGHPSPEVKFDFHKAVLEMCSNTEGVWDFYTAESPFRNVLRISPAKESEFFEQRLSHVIKVLRWSAPSQLGKCWSTWNVYVRNLGWLSSSDIIGILEMLDQPNQSRYIEADLLWLSKLRKSKNFNEECERKLDALISEIDLDVA